MGVGLSLAGVTVLIVGLWPWRKPAVTRWILRFLALAFGIAGCQRAVANHLGVFARPKP